MSANVLNNKSGSREIDTDFLKIYGNCLEFENTIIQLSNVALVENNPIAPPEFPLWTLAGLLLGFVCLYMKVLVGILVGLILIVASGIVIYIWYKRDEREKLLKKMVIVTNSGRAFSIMFEMGDFLDDVVNALTEIIAHPDHHSDIIINIKDNTIAPGGHIIDSVNEFNSIGGRR